MKVLFFDIDGTLIDKRRGVTVIPEGVRNELNRIQSLGHKVFISSGRPKAMMNEPCLLEGFDGYIQANGGYVEINGKSIHEELMDYELAKKTTEILEELHCDYMMATAKELYIDPTYLELYNFFNAFGHGKMFTKEFDKEEVLHRVIKIEANVTNKDRERVEKHIKEHFGYTLNFDEHGSENAFEFYSKSMSKAVGVSKVLDFYGLTKEDAYAFGDGLNDMEMFENVGTGVAMGNAVDALKEIADIVCKDIDKNGLEDILKELF